jgi:hypothetical protein
VTPDYNFKFKGGLAEKLAATDLDAALADKPKKKKKKKKLATTDALNQEGSPAEGGPDTRFFEVEIERPTGVEFATDLSLKYVYVMEVKDNSPAQLATIPVQQGDQLVGINGQECIGLPFAEVRSSPSSPCSTLTGFRASIAGVSGSLADCGGAPCRNTEVRRRATGSDPARKGAGSPIELPSVPGQQGRTAGGGRATGRGGDPGAHCRHRAKRERGTRPRALLCRCRRTSASEISESAAAPVGARGVWAWVEQREGAANRPRRGAVCGILNSPFLMVAGCGGGEGWREPSRLAAAQRHRGVQCGAGALH